MATEAVTQEPVEPRTFVVEYDSNNSGGAWWLKDADWRRLEAAGWTVQWLGERFCRSKYDHHVGGRPAPDTCPSDRDCPGHRGADSYAEAVAAGKEARWRGSLARSASIEVEAYSRELAEGVGELWWSEALPKQDATAAGCSCCGQPHYFRAAALAAAARTAGSPAAEETNHE